MSDIPECCQNQEHDNEITESFCKHIRKYLDRDNIGSVEDINNGYCEEIARDVIKDVYGSIENGQEAGARAVTEIGVSGVDPFEVSGLGTHTWVT